MSVKLTCDTEFQNERCVCLTLSLSLPLSLVPMSAPIAKPIRQLILDLNFWNREIEQIYLYLFHKYPTSVFFVTLV